MDRLRDVIRDRGFQGRKRKAFLDACTAGDLETITSLCIEFPTLNFDFANGYKNACFHDHLHIMIFLESNAPQIYHPLHVKESLSKYHSMILVKLSFRVVHHIIQEKRFTKQWFLSDFLNDLYEYTLDEQKLLFKTVSSTGTAIWNYGLAHETWRQMVLMHANTYNIPWVNVKLDRHIQLLIFTITNNILTINVNIPSFINNTDYAKAFCQQLIDGGLNIQYLKGHSVFEDVALSCLYHKNMALNLLQYDLRLDRDVCFIIGLYMVPCV